MRATKVVFPAAGLGTRFLPATKALPKELLPLVDTPLIQYGVEEAVQSGLTDVYIVTGRGKGAIEDYFDASVELEGVLASRNALGLLETVRRVSETINVAYIRQREAKGLGHAVLCAKPHLAGETFGVILSDDVISAEVPCMAQLLAVSESMNAPVVALMRVPASDLGSYGIIEGSLVAGGKGKQEVYRLNRLVEKPHPAEAPSDLAVIGRYVLTPNIWPFLEAVKPGAGGEIQLTDALNALAKEQPIYGLCFEGNRYDAGNKLGFIKATLELGLRRADLRDELKEYLAGLVARDCDR